MIYNKGLRPSPFLEFAQSEASDLHVQLLPRIQSPSICCTNVWFSRMFYILFYRSCIGFWYICLKFKVLSQCRLMLFPASLWCSAFYFVAWSFVLTMICFVWSLLHRCCSEFFAMWHRCHLASHGPRQRIEYKPKVSSAVHCESQATVHALATKFLSQPVHAGILI